MIDQYVKPNIKAIIAAIVAALTAVSVALSDGTITPQEIVAAVIALLGGGIVTYTVPNVPNEEAENGE